MLKKERQAYILHRLNLHNKVLSTNLCIEIGVSEDTIRRDLQELANAGRLIKVHGGALSNAYSVGNPVAVGESMGWKPKRVNKTVEISSGLAHIDCKIKIIGSDGSDQRGLQIVYSCNKYVNYSYYWSAFIGREYHHVLSGMRVASPNSAVRVFTVL